MTNTLMPAAFLGHGNPMNAIENNRYTQAWKNFGESIIEPKGVLVVSAHWYGDFSMVTAMAQPRTIHDFYGFPEELFQVQYPAPGSRELAEKVAEIAQPARVDFDFDSWGLDHGTWSVLVHAFPKADIPVVQLSINARETFEYHLELGARLAPLREAGIVIIGSGNVVHNLGLMNWKDLDGAFDWAQRFGEAANKVMLDSPRELSTIKNHDDFKLAVPTPDHFIPLLYIAGLSSVSQTQPEVLVDGYAYGSVSMTSYKI